MDRVCKAPIYPEMQQGSEHADMRAADPVIIFDRRKELR